MNDFNNFQSFLRNICHNEKSKHTISPRTFCDQVFSLLQSQETLDTNSSSFGPCGVRNNEAVLRLCSLSAVGVILHSISRCDKPCSNSVNSDATNQMINQSTCTNQAEGFSLTKSSLHFEEKENPNDDLPQERDTHGYWISDQVEKDEYFQSLCKHLLSNGINLLLVQSLFSKCQFTSHLARTALLNGIHRKHLQVDDIILALVKKVKDKDEATLSVVFGFLRALFSTDEPCVTDWENLLFILQCGSDRFLANINQLRSENSTYLMEYTWFLQVFCKFVSKHSSEYVQELVYSYIITGLTVVSGRLFLINSQISHLVCTKFFKAVNTVLDLNPIELKVTTKIVKTVAHTYLTVFPCIVASIKHSPTLKAFNFVGNKMESDDSTDGVMKGHCEQSVSSMLRLLVLVGLKSCASLICENTVSEDQEHVNHFIQHDVCSILNLSSGSFVSDWLAKLFADHDQMWISSLFSLVTIYNQISKGQSKRISEKCQGAVSRNDCKMDCLHHHKDKDVQTLPCASSCPSSKSSHLLASLNPFILFLQFLSFIDFDHLTLADFLLSPETLFLSYLTMLLHCVRGHWENFKEICQHFEQNKNSDSLDGPVQCERNKHKRKRHLSECNSFNEIRIFHSASENVDAVSRKHEITNSISNLVSYSDSESSKETASNDSSEEEVNDQILFESIHSLDSERNQNSQIPFPCKDEQMADHASNNDSLDCVMGVLIRLRFHLERLNNSKLIPFKIDPLLSLIISCEDIYENI